MYAKSYRPLSAPAPRHGPSLHNWYEGRRVPLLPGRTQVPAPAAIPFKRSTAEIMIPFFPVRSSKGGKARSGAGSPEPDRVGGMQTLFSSFFIQRMMRKDLIAFLHHPSKRRIRRKIRPDPPGQDIVGRGKLRHGPVVLHQQMPVAGSRIKCISGPVYASFPSPSSRAFRRAAPSRLLIFIRTVVQDHPVLIRPFLSERVTRLQRNDTSVSFKSTPILKASRGDRPL